MADVLVKFNSDTQDLIKRLTDVENKFRQLEATATKSGKTAEQSFKGAATEGKNFGDQVRGVADNLSGNFTSAFAGIAEGVIAAFAVERIVAFGKESLKAFQDAEVNAVKLKAAVGVNGGLQEDFENLIEQSEKLQKITIFSDDDIQKAQTMALQFGLTVDQVKELTPVITDYASATGRDLSDALSAVIGGINGQTRELKKSGVVIDENLSKTEKLTSITDQLSQKYKGQAEILANTSEGANKRFANQIEDIKEGIGEFISGLTDAGAIIGSFILNGFQPLSDSSENLANNLKLSTDQINALNTAALNTNILLLQQQIDHLSESGTDVTKLVEQLDKLKNQKIDLEVKGLTDQELKSRIAELEKIPFKLKDVTNELNTLNAESKKRNLDFIISEQDLTRLTKQELQKRLSALEEASKTQNNFNITDSIDKIKDRLKELASVDKQTQDDIIKQRQAASEKLAELAEQSANAGSISSKNSPIEKLKEEQRIALDNAQKLFEQSKKGEDDFENLRKAKIGILNTTNAKIYDAEKKLQSDIKALNEKNNQEDLSATLSDIDRAGELRKQAVIKEAEAKGDFSKKAQEDLNKELENIDARTAEVKIETQRKYGESVVDNQKDVTNNLKDGYAEDAANFEKSQQEKLAALQAFLNQVNGVVAIINELGNTANALTSARVQSIQEEKDTQLSAYDEEFERLDKLNQDKVISDRQYQKQKDDLLKKRAETEKQFDKEQRESQRKQAEINKVLALFNIAVKTAEAIMTYTAQGNPFLAIAAGILGAAQAATVAATPLPKFAKGTKYVDDPKAAQGTDTIPAWLNRGERIITAEDNKSNWGIYEAVREKNWKQLAEDIRIAPYLRQAKKRIDDHEQKSFAENIASSLLVTANSLTAHDMARIASKGTEIRNSKELAKDIAGEIIEALPRSYGRWN